LHLPHFCETNNFQPEEKRAVQVAQRKEFDIANYRTLMAVYLDDFGERADVFWNALDFAAKAHAGQWRKSGEAYILHPCMVAMILAEELDVREPDILAAALLHDTVEDVEEVTVELVRELFGQAVADIVDGCTKVTQSSRDRQTFYKLVHQKLFSGAAARLEVMLVKLADRLHNLRTLNALPKHKRQKIAEETLDIYAPMARVMGLFNLKRELFNLALKFKFPRQGQKVIAMIRQLEQEPEILGIAEKLREEMRKAWIDCKITVRVRGLWAYFDPIDKVLVKEVVRPVEFILVINNVQSCYTVLGILNQNYPPIPRTIRDFIANPKPSGYQGLHAKANIKGQSYLFKIRTPGMETRNQRGILREWSGETTKGDSFEKDLREMFDILGTDDDFSHRDMIAVGAKKEIYTYTPKGDRICLPRQATVLDFAFKVHTQVGMCCVGAIVDRTRVNPDYRLKDGDQVKILRQDKPVLFEPELQKLCQTPRARSGLAKMFKKRRLAVTREIGQSLVRQEMKHYGIPVGILDKKESAKLLKKLGCKSLEQLYERIGEGLISLRDLMSAVIKGPWANQNTLQPPTGVLNIIYFSTLDPLSIKFSACCHPLPTDKGLLGLLNERGVSVHRKECQRIKELKIQREDVVELRWRLQETVVAKTQKLVVYKSTRHRLLMMLAVAPDTMRVVDIVSLSRIVTSTPDWQISFDVPDLYNLRRILQHFNKANIAHEFILEQ
jgi:GTP pyrophosphokinase